MSQPKCRGGWAGAVLGNQAAAAPASSRGWTPLGLGDEEREQSGTMGAHGCSELLLNDRKPGEERMTRDPTPRVG